MVYLLILKNFILRFFPYIITAVFLLVIVSSAYYRGVSDKAEETELKNSKALIVLMEKVNKIEEFSREEATKAMESTSSINSKLDAVLLKSRGRVVVTKDCKPGAEFASTWNQINEVLKDEKPINSPTQ